MDGYWTDTFGDWIFVSDVGREVVTLAQVMEEIEDMPWYLVDQANDLCQVVAERDAEYTYRVNRG